MNILLDMNISPEWIEPFRSAGFHCQHWSEIGDSNAKDTVIFQWATENGYIVYTHDLDFGAILAATNARFPSVIQLRHQSFFPDAQEDVQRVTTYLKQYQDLLVAGALLTIDEQKAKIRVLPIH